MSYIIRFIIPPLSATVGYLLWNKIYESKINRNELQIKHNFTNDILKCLSGYVIFTTGGFFIGKHLGKKFFSTN